MKESSVIVGNTYNEQLSTSYFLSIQLSLDGLSFSVLDPVTNTFVAMGSYDFEDIDEHFAKHEEVLLKNELFRQQFKKTIVSIESRQFSIMPKSLYEADKAADVLKFIGCTVSKDDKILTDEIEMTGAVTIFTVPNFLYYFLQTQFVNLQIVHHSTPVINAVTLKMDDDKKKNVVNVVFTGDGVTIVVAEQNALKLCNKFKYKEVNDLVYIVMYTLGQLGLNNDQTKIVLSGNIERNDERAVLVHRFAHNVGFAKLPKYFDYSFAVMKPEHKFVNLFNLSLCV